MNTFQLYRTWNALLTQWQPQMCQTRRTNLTWLIVGLCLARSVQLSAIVRQWPLTAKVVSLTRRLSRFLDNGAVRPAIWFRPVARRVLEHWGGRTVTLIVDATKVGAGHQLIMVAVAYKRRALPVAWAWVKWVRGHSPAATQVAVLRRVQNLLPAQVAVVLAADAGFGSVALLRHADAWHWGYVVRQTSKHLVQGAGQTTWQPFAQLVTRRGQTVWWPQARFTRRWAYDTALVAHWAPHEKEPWLLTTNLATARLACQAYARRMWIEELFGDLKGLGLDIERTHLRHAARLSRLMLAVCLLYLWLIFLGGRIIQAGYRHWVDRHDRRDLSRFRIAVDLLVRCLVLQKTSPVTLNRLVSGD